MAKSGDGVIRPLYDPASRLGREEKWFSNSIYVTLKRGNLSAEEGVYIIDACDDRYYRFGGKQCCQYKINISFYFGGK